ncbi:hypothetical protein [Caulobacter sp. AP07]|uniref:hypothetical protein n=1 Tax=Caulobacter sp. AP07 TaxID=1144304 RepID=UPI0012FBFD8E|nr:hypothetical protein [Caulobacter sp. AP07]
METFHLRVFQRQVLDQCKFLLKSADEINAGMALRDTDHILYGIQNLLNAGANISKMLWGQKGKFANQRAQLRDSIGVADDSPLREVTMRNNFEHIDERIDRWWVESKAHNLADKIIGPKDGAIVGMEPTDMFRMFDPNTTNVIFWGEEFNMRALVTEAQRIFPLLQAEANKPHWQEPVFIDVGNG